MVMDLVTQIEKQIVDAEKRLALSLEKSPWERGAIDEQQAIQNVVHELHGKLAAAKRDGLRISFGLDVGDKKETVPSYPRRLTAPSRVFATGERKKLDRLNSDENDNVEYKHIHKKHWDADSSEKTEDQFQRILNLFSKQGLNRDAAFSQGMYGAMIGMFSKLNCRIKASEEFNLTKRKQLEQRITELEVDRERVKSAFENFRYCGTWDSNRIYAKGNSVTRGGSLWMALKDNGLEPGGNDAWQLCVKRGRDGKEAR